jgi:hypothetical protein
MFYYIAYNMLRIQKSIAVVVGSRAHARALSEGT